MRQLLDRVATTPGCRLLPVAGLPALEPGHVLPRDMASFYDLCGGADLFEGAPYGVRMSSPSDLRPSNPVIVGQQVDDDISATWYIAASGGGGEFISIDLHPDRLGRCYDSFREVHGVPGSCAIIAQSFTDLIERLIASKGSHWYWLDPEFESLGDAYDVVR